MDHENELTCGGFSFKTCSNCGFVWPTRQAFLEDSSLTMIGYQVSFEDLVAGLFLFNHSCETTLGVKAGVFQDLYSGPLYGDRLTGTADCMRFCLYKDNLLACTAKCEFASVREVIQLIRNWPKKTPEIQDGAGRSGRGAGEPGP